MKTTLIALATLISTNVFAKTCQEFIRPNQDYKADILLKCKADSVNKFDSSILPARLDQVICVEVGTYKTGKTYLSHAFFFEDSIASGSITLYDGNLGLTKTKISIDNDSITAQSKEKITNGGFFPKAFRSQEAHIADLQAEKQIYTLKIKSGAILTTGEVDYELKATCTREL